ncbi:MAG: hypothetical protein JRJ38_17980 [Deltaproteobacteria bacterium]|nr:hypothetical protein [Deltaproteobacteria bacterium]
MKIKERNPDISENEILAKVLISRYFDYDEHTLARLLYEYPNIRLLTLAVIASEFGEDKTSKYINQVARDINNVFGEVGLVSIDMDLFFKVFGALEGTTYVAFPSIGIWSLRLGMKKQELMQNVSETTRKQLESSKSEDLCCYEKVKFGDLLMDIYFCFIDNQLNEVNFDFLQPFHPIKEKLIERYGKPLRERKEGSPSSRHIMSTITYWEIKNLTIRLDYAESKLGGISFTAKSK